jgi:hypothetical protein
MILSLTVPMAIRSARKICPHVSAPSGSAAAAFVSALGVLLEPGGLLPAIAVARISLAAAAAVACASAASSVASVAFFSSICVSTYCPAFSAENAKITRNFVEKRGDRLASYAETSARSRRRACRWLALRSAAAAAPR